jgi:AraC-like DNA-binding protein
MEGRAAPGRCPLIKRFQRVQVANPHLIQTAMLESLSQMEQTLANYKNTQNRTFEPADRRLFQIDPRSYLSTIAVTHVGSLRVAAIAHRRGTVCVTKPPGLGAFCLCLPIQGRLGLRTPACKKVEGADPNTGLIYSGESGTQFTTGDETETLSIWIPAAKLKSCLETLADRSIAGELVFRPAIDLTNSTGASLRELARFVGQELSRPDSLISQDIGFALIEDLLCRWIVQGLPHNHTDLLERRSPSADLRAVRRAEEYFQSRLTDSISLSDLADAAGCSVRALQLAFRSARDTTPMAALRQARLDQARQVLMRGGAEISVIDVALRFGFSNPGRFAHLYRAAFHERPLETLRKRRT